MKPVYPLQKKKLKLQLYNLNSKIDKKFDRNFLKFKFKRISNLEILNKFEAKKNENFIFFLS